MSGRTLPRHTQNFCLTSERINLTLTLQPIGSRDLICTLFGGDYHIGAVAIGRKNDCGSINVDLIEIPNHREGELAQHICQKLCQAYQCTILTAVGIHYDKITKNEIQTVLDLSDQLLHKALSLKNELT